MNKNFYLLLPAASIAFLATSCSKLGELKSDAFTVTPTPLECIGGTVPATISANIPEKYMKKNAVVTCIPVLKWDGGQATGASATFQGEKVEANAQVIPYKTGGHVTMRTSFPFQEGMENSDLYMEFKAMKGKKEVKLPAVKIGYGTNCSELLVRNCIKSANNGVAKDNFQRVINQKQAATIKFLIAQANLRGSELNSQNVKEFIAKLKEIKSDEESLVLNNIEISAYASPDGKYDFNKRLAEDREKNSEKFLNTHLRKNKIDTNVDAKYEAEDWEGFKELVSQSNIQDKDLILRILSMYQDPEQREQEIKNISVVYKELAEAVLPELRRARLTINYDVIGRSDEEILDVMAKDPKALSVEEMVYAGNLLANNDAQKEEYYKKTVQVYPNDYRAYNNLAEIEMRKGNVDAAKNYLNQALKANANAPEANANLGLLALQSGDTKSAELYLSKASNSNNANEALGYLYLSQGQYTKAAQNLNGVSSNGAALAQILTKDYASAEKTLSGIKNGDATTSYLKAILAARQDNKSAVVSNLKNAISADRSYAQRAANDVEFKAFESDIESIIK